MRASWIFTANDVIANMGVIAAGLLVMWLDSFWPDLIIGSLIALVVLAGARRIIAESRAAQARAETPCAASGCADACMDAASNDAEKSACDPRDPAEKEGRASRD